MLYLSDVCTWLKNFEIADNYYVGKLNGKKDKSIGVYQRKNVQSPVKAVGQPSSYDVKGISLLIHWNKNADETEKAAYELYKKLDTAKRFYINGVCIYILSLLQSEPIDVGTDDNGVFERVIEFNLYFERK